MDDFKAIFSVFAFVLWVFAFMAGASTNKKNKKAQAEAYQAQQHERVQLAQKQETKRVIDIQVAKEKMQRAKKLIQQKKYAEARKILRTVNHPIADQWLERLDRIAPKRRSSGGCLLFGGMIIVLTVFAAIGITVINNQQRYSAIAKLPTQIVLPTERPTKKASPTATSSNTPRPTNTASATPDRTLVALQTSNALGMTQVQNTAVHATRSARTATAISNYVAGTQIGMTKTAQFQATATSMTAALMLPECRSQDWFMKVSIASPYEEVSTMPFPACVVKAREYLLLYIKEQEDWDVGIDDYETHRDASDRYFDSFMTEIHNALSQDVGYTYTGGSTGGGSYSGGTLCNDGTYSSSTGRGTCSHHGGVAH